MKHIEAEEHLVDIQREMIACINKQLSDPMSGIFILADLSEPQLRVVAQFIQSFYIVGGRK